MLYKVKGETWGYEAEQRMRGSRKERETRERGKNRIQRKSGALCPEPAQIGALLGCINFARPLCEQQAAPHSQVTHWLHCPLLTNMCKHTDTDRVGEKRTWDSETTRPHVYEGISEDFLPTKPQACLLGLIQDPPPPVHFPFCPVTQRTGVCSSPLGAGTIHPLTYGCNRDPLFQLLHSLQRQNPRVIFSPEFYY